MSKMDMISLRAKTWRSWCERVGTSYTCDICIHREIMGLEGGGSSLGVEGRNCGGGVVNWWNSSEQFQICSPNNWGSYLAPYEQNSPPKWQLRTRCSGHSCRRSVQALARMLCQVPSMSFCSQFCSILHPHRVAVPFPPNFWSPWRNSFVQVHDRTCRRQNLGSPLQNYPKTT